MTGPMKLGVVGGGQMGQGIAQIAAHAGLDVILVDVTAELAAGAIAKLGKTLDRLVDKGKLTADVRDAVRGRLRSAEGHGALADRVIRIAAGRVVADGAPADLLPPPGSGYSLAPAAS